MALQGHYPLFGTATQYGKDSGAYPGNYNSWANVSSFRSAAPRSRCLHVHQPCLACKACPAPSTGMSQCVDGIRVRVLTPAVCCMQLLSSIYANKVTAYLNGHDHSMTVGNPQQANVSQAYASSWHSQDDSMPSHLSV